MTDNVVERVHVFKFLGVLLDDNLKWDSHVDAVCAKASIRLHLLKILKRCSLNSDDLLYFYTTVIRPILEYACPAWHNSLTNEQSRQIESVQKRALSIIFGHTWGHYDQLCSDKQILTLHNRRTELSKSFFNQSVLDKKSCLHYLLPLPRTGFVDKLRSRLQYIPQTAKTGRFQHSFLIYSLNNYQT